jgi:branched-chain amino acid transport system substrate-binding protein
MKKYTWAIVVVIILIIVGIYIGTTKNKSVKGFNVGMISILSGDYAAVGENFRNGAILANEEWNKAHPDAQIKLSIEDDGFSGGRGMSAYQKLVSTDKIDALINVSTPTIDSIYNTVAASGIPVIQGGEQGQAPKDDNVFGILPDSISSEYDYGVYMRNQGVKEMPLVYTNLDAMVRFVKAFKEGFQGSTTDFVISPDEKDFRTHALKVSALNPKTVGLFIYPQQGAQFMKEYLKIVKNKPQLFFDTNFQSGFADYQRIMGDTTVLDGALVGTIKSDASESFKSKYKTRFNSDPGFLTDSGYDAFNLLVATHADDKSTWVSNLKKVSFDGASGKIEFTTTGNRKPETKIMTVKGGKLTDLK